MPSTPYAKLLVTLNGGGPVSGGIVTTLGVTVQLSAESTAFWTTQRFEIADYPPGFPCPAGWSTDPNTLAYFWSLSSVPPPFTLPLAQNGGLWGKYMFWLTVNGGLLDGALAVQLVDKSTGLSIYGPGGTHDLAFQEENQFNAVTQWNWDLKHDLRVLDALAYAITTIGTPDVNPTPLTVPLRDNTGQVRATSFATASTLVADEGALQLQAAPQTAVAMLGVAAAAVPLLSASDAHTLQLGDGNEITTVDFMGEEVVDVGALISFAAGDTNPLITQAQASGTGTAAGQPLTFKGQQGQAQSGTNANNNGGAAIVSGGDPGTGGSGGAGAQGSVQLLAGGGAISYGLAQVSTLPSQLVNLDSAVPILTGTQWTIRATFSGKLVGPTTTVIYEQEVKFAAGNLTGTVKILSGLGGIDATSIWQIAAPTQPWSTMSGANTCNVTNVVADGSGHCQVTVDQTVNIRNGSTVYVSGVNGATGANVAAIVDSLSGSTFTLRGTTFGGLYTSGGTVTVQACVVAVAVGASIQFQAEGLRPANWTANESVTAGDVRNASGKIYLYTKPGNTDPTTAPTSTGTNVTDGTAECDYLDVIGAAPLISWKLSELRQIPI